jgi:uncharacterized protein YhaN
MRITGFHVGGFGLLHDLKVTGLGPGTTVVYGPNEAGKSTLHAFLVRTMFGHPRANDARGRNRYEPLRGGRHGGLVLAQDADGGGWEIHRHTTGTPVLRVVGPSGSESTSAEALVDLLGRGMDEDRYEQVFAINLDDLADLGSLEGQALDDLLLDAATVGAGRSLRRAIAELEERRDGLWTPRSRKPPLNAALAELRDAERQLHDAQERAGSYRDQQAQVAALDAELDRMRSEQDLVRAEARRLERLQQLWPTWQQLVDAEQRVADAGDVVLPDGLAERVTDLQRQRDEAVRGAEEARTQADALAAEADGLAVDDQLAAVAERVGDHAGGLGLQRDRRTRLEQVTGRARAAEQLAQGALGILPDGWDADRVTAAPADPTLLPAVRGAVDRLRTAEQDLQAAQQAVDAADQKLASARTSAAASADAVGPEPPADIDQRRNAVAALRGALPDLERIEAGVAPRRPLPGWVLTVAAILTVMLLVTTAIAMATDAILVGAIAFVLAALSAAITAGVWRNGTTATSAAAVDTTSAPDLRRQVIEAGEVLGLSPPIARRDLEAASLATEGLAEQRRQWQERQATAQRDAQAVTEADQALQDATQRRDQQQEVTDRARLAWREAAERSGLDLDTDPTGAAELLAAIHEARRALLDADREAAERDTLARQVQAFDDTTAKLCATAGRPVGDNPDGSLSRLAEDCAADAATRAERARLARDAGQRRDEAATLDDRAAGLDAELADAYLQAGVADSDGFAGAVAADAARRKAQEDLDRAEREIRERLGGDDEADRMRAELATGRVAAWQQELERLQQKEAELSDERDGLVRQHNTAQQELAAIGQDDAVVTAASEVEALTARCQELAEQWATTDLAARLLTTTLERFEHAHQPAVLSEAGTLLAQATAGRWTGVRRIDDELYVTAGGDDRVPAAALSRGATEQLYLCLRLALAEELNQHGARLPLLIDDLMANADPERADGLARILADVARHQQVIVFTCNPATADRVVAADPTAGVLAMQPAGGGASWQRKPGGGTTRPDRDTDPPGGGSDQLELDGTGS